MNLKPLLSLLKSIWYNPSKEKKQKIIRLIEWIKNFVESDEGQIIVNIIQHLKLDAKFLDFVKKNLPFILGRLELTHNTVNVNMAVRQSIGKLRGMTKKQRVKEWELMAGMLYQKSVNLPDEQIEMAKMEMKSAYLDYKGVA